MNRRDFSAATLLGTAALASPAAHAQGQPVEGQQYVKLSQPLPVSVPPGNIEVIEFFWYGCPHCAAFEPELDAWARAQPDYVVFSRVPVAFRAEPFTTHQRIFYALEALGQLAEITAFMTKNGIDASKFMEAFGSFTTQTRIKRARVLVDGYKIDGVPAIGVQGRFYTSGTMARGNGKALSVADFLIQRLHKTG